MKPFFSYINQVLNGNERPWRTDRNQPDRYFQALLNQTISIPLVQISEHYEVVYKPYLLFSSKVRYYCRRISNDVLDGLNRLLESVDPNGVSGKYLLTQFQRAIIKNVHSASHILRTSPISIDTLLDDEVDFLNQRSQKEQCVIVHFVVAQLAWCWMEYVDRFASKMQLDCLDICSFYVNYLGQKPNHAFVIQAYKPQKGFSLCRPDCSFLYLNQDADNRNEGLQELHEKLCKHGYIPKETELKQLVAIFNGAATDVRITWLKEPSMLATVFKDWINVHKVVVPWPPKEATIWQVISNRFLDAEGQPMKYLGKEKERKQTASIRNEIVSCLTDWVER